MKSTYIKPEAKFITEWKQTYEGKAFWNLGCYTTKAADILNAVTHWAVEKLDVKIRYKRNRYYGTPDKFDRSDKVGGGLVVKTEPDIIIDSLGEVCVHLNNSYALYKFCRKAQTNAEILSTIKEKFAYALKQMWKLMSCKDVMKIYHNPVDKSGEIEVTLAEYRALYEHLKERKPEKTAKVYGQAAVDDIISKPVQDQFVITAVETIDAEINTTEADFLKKKEELENKRKAEIEKVNAAFNASLEAIREEMNAKVAELRAQKQSMVDAVREAV